MVVQINGDHRSFRTDSTTYAMSVLYHQRTTVLRPEYGLKKAVERLTFGDCSEAVLYE